MIKRLFDIVVSFCGLLASSPGLLVIMLLVWRQDRHSPFYVAPRVGLNGVLFRMVKMRSMAVNAGRTAVASTAASDRRITPIGQFIRRFKIDEVTQLWNVLLGDMSLVGPRPQVPQDVVLYTDVERGLLSARPGITEFASIVFADEGDILTGREDPNLAYQQLIRPWKSRLGLFYIANRSLLLDIRLIALTVANSLSRRWALKWVSAMLQKQGAPPELVLVALREAPLRPHAPPGADDVFQYAAEVTDSDTLDMDWRTKSR